MNHLRQYCDKKCLTTECMYCNYFVCMWCQGGIAGEHSTLTTDCVGRSLNTIEAYAIARGVINFRNNFWVFESKEQGEKRELESVHPFLCNFLQEKTTVERSVRCLPTK